MSKLELGELCPTAEVRHLATALRFCFYLDRLHLLEIGGASLPPCRIGVEAGL